MTNYSKHILLIYRHMRTGGIETLIVRMANWLLKNNFRVTILLQEPGELLGLLDPGVEVDILGQKKSYFFIPFFGKQYLKKYEGKNIDYLYSYGPEACYFAAFVYKYGFKHRKPIFLNGIYHPSEFALDGGISKIDKFHIDLYNTYINDGSKIFMSEEVRSGNEALLDAQVTNGIIWPLPIDSKSLQTIKRQITPFKIVSIGRLAKFKTYNIYMFDVVQELLHEGYDVTWEVYGDGPSETEMKNILENRGLANRIFMKGVLSYEKFSDALSSAHVFVGMGTSLIEAGFCRVPCVPAIAGDHVGVTYGALYKLPYYTCGEVLSDDFITIKITDAIRSIFDMEKTEYDVEAELTFQYVQPYSIKELMQDFVDHCSDAPIAQIINSYPNWKFFLYWSTSLFAFLRKKVGIKRIYRKFIRS